MLLLTGRNYGPLQGRAAHRGDVSGAVRELRHGSTLRGERMLSPLPLYHTSGILNAGLVPLLAGCSIVIPSARGFRDPAVVQRYWELVDRYGITIGGSVPTAVAAVASHPPAGPVPTFRYMLTGGAAHEPWPMRSRPRPEPR
ncbi:AMP-binding protein [Caulobacter segnis]